VAFSLWALGYPTPELWIRSYRTQPHQRSIRRTIDVVQRSARSEPARHPCRTRAQRRARHFKWRAGGPPFHKAATL